MADLAHIGKAAQLPTRPRTARFAAFNKCHDRHNLAGIPSIYQRNPYAHCNRCLNGPARSGIGFSAPQPPELLH